jgi:hypothetical protein
MKKLILPFAFLLLFGINYAGTAPCIQCASLLDDGKCIFMYSLGTTRCVSIETVMEVVEGPDDPWLSTPNCNFWVSNRDLTCP